MKRGDIVLALFPHASGTPPKRRPVLVIQADYYNHKISNVLVGLCAVARNPAFADLAGPEEYIYSPTDGEPFDAEE
jgi:mRNA-degrading endonuclease toxin of MazEF toxin-antitoxin module